MYDKYWLSTQFNCIFKFSNLDSRRYLGIRKGSSNSQFKTTTILGRISQYRSSFATIYKRVNCSKTFRDLGQTFAPLDITYRSQCGNI